MARGPAPPGPGVRYLPQPERVRLVPSVVVHPWVLLTERGYLRIGAGGGGTATIDPMSVTIEPTPNPNAMKFTVGQPVGGPKTFLADGEIDDPMAEELLGLPGVTSVFMTADFVTLSKTAEGTWDEIAPRARAILEKHYPD